MSVTLDLTFSDESFQRLEKLAKKMGHRNMGNTLEVAAQLLEIALDATGEGKQIGSLEQGDSRAMFKQIHLPTVKKVEAGDEFCGRVINCENCHKDFTLTTGTVYRENPGHESAMRIDCPHCTHSVEF